jgi:glycogen debranching enzyme
MAPKSTAKSAIKKAVEVLNPIKPSSISLPVPAKNGGQAQAGKTPLKTPQDEAFAFFSGEGDGNKVQVWELWLEEDGGPGEGKDVSF